MLAIIALALVLAATVAASAAPIKLVCNLTRTTVLNRVDRETRTLTIDFSAHTVTLGGYAPEPITHADGDQIDFGAKDLHELVIGETMYGNINRASGALFIRGFPINGTSFVYEGICKPAQNELF
jgi:hypothetical protein